MSNSSAACSFDTCVVVVVVVDPRRWPRQFSLAFGGIFWPSHADIVQIKARILSLYNDRLERGERHRCQLDFGRALDSNWLDEIWRLIRKRAAQGPATGCAAGQQFLVPLQPTQRRPSHGSGEKARRDRPQSLTVSQVGRRWFASVREGREQISRLVPEATAAAHSTREWRSFASGIMLPRKVISLQSEPRVGWG